MDISRREETQRRRTHEICMRSVAEKFPLRYRSKVKILSCTEEQELSVRTALAAWWENCPLGREPILKMASLRNRRETQEVGGQILRQIRFARSIIELLSGLVGALLGSGVVVEATAAGVGGGVTVAGAGG
jgi:hypothetical protein